MIVAFENMVKEGAEASVNMTAIALAIASWRKDIRVIGMESGFGERGMEQAVDSRYESMVAEPFAYMDGEGMDYLLTSSSHGFLDEISAGDGVIYIRKNLGYVRSAVRKNRMVYEKELEQECQRILTTLANLADYVFINCSHSGEQVRRKIQKLADIVVVNVLQSGPVLDEYFSYPSEYQYKAMYCIGGYMGGEPYNLKNIQRLYRMGADDIGVIPYNAEFLSLLKKGRAFSFFENRHRNARYGSNRQFYNKTFQMAELIIRRRR